MSGEVTSEGKRLIKDWLHCKSHVENLEREVIKAKNDEAETAKRLAEWMVPEAMLSTVFG